MIETLARQYLEDISILTPAEYGARCGVQGLRAITPRFDEPALAKGKCIDVSADFRLYCLESDIHSELIDCFGNLEPTDTGFYVNRTNLYHCMVWFEKYGLACDLTARQFWAKSDYPMIMTERELERFWNKVESHWYSYTPSRWQPSGATNDYV